LVGLAESRYLESRKGHRIPLVNGSGSLKRVFVTADYPSNPEPCVLRVSLSYTPTQFLMQSNSSLSLPHNAPYFMFPETQASSSLSLRHSAHPGGTPLQDGWHGAARDPQQGARTPLHLQLRGTNYYTRTQSYLVRWVNAAGGHTISWSIKPHKKSM
jgi:hypothetical protein